MSAVARRPLLADHHPVYHKPPEMDPAVSSLPHHCPRLPPRPPLSRRLSSARSACFSALRSSRDRPRLRFPSDRGAFFVGHPHCPSRSVSPPLNNLPHRRRLTAAAGAVAFWGWSGSRRKGGRKGGGRGGLDRAAVASWASIFLLAHSIRTLLVLQPMDILAVLLEHGEGLGIGGRGGALGILKRGLSGGGQTRRSRRTWKGALELVVKVVSAAAAAAAIWLLLFGKGLL